MVLVLHFSVHSGWRQGRYKDKRTGPAAIKLRQGTNTSEKKFENYITVDIHKIHVPHL